ncbi:Formate/nitrite transporter-domain-containing protein [Apiospora arundinis]|uniref:Formate/nitrite transporter-domain-containing protein n=1 Tax=Apiospora arundinis TaxID=335852 RepID=A0ABR2HJW3_9PEZI
MAADPTRVLVTNLSAFSPTQTIELVGRAGVIKGNTRPDKVFLSGVSAGCLLSFACAAVLSCNASPWYAENAPGLLRLIAALIFPFGFVMITLTGADLFTGTTLYTTVAVLQRRLSLWKMATHWFLCFWGNLAGSLFLAVVIFGYGGVFSASPFKEAAITFAVKKQVTPAWHEIFLRAVGCNWLVCLACLLSLQARGVGSKIAAMWWPVFAFVALGLDHVVANMFFVPLAIFLGAPGLSTGLYIWKGVIPVLLGNIVGGGLMVGVYYWYMYLCGEPEVMIDGVGGPSGPVLAKRQGDSVNDGSGLSDAEEGNVIHRQASASSGLKTPASVVANKSQ